MCVLLMQCIGDDVVHYSTVQHVIRVCYVLCDANATFGASVWIIERRGF